jgi:hypothetical protein
MGLFVCLASASPTQIPLLASLWQKERLFHSLHTSKSMIPHNPSKAGNLAIRIVRSEVAPGFEDFSFPHRVARHKGILATHCCKQMSWVLRTPFTKPLYHRWGVLAVVIDGVVSECENENYDCYSRLEYPSLSRN